ncbi:MAG: helix-turn-helix domain-containing protein [Actinomycetota bacterium]
MPSHFSPTNLRALREEAGVTRERLAVELDRSYPSVAGYERGTTAPPTQVLEQIATVLGVSPGDLFVDDGQPMEAVL